MRTLVFKSDGKLWPTVSWEGSKLVVYYLGEDEDDVTIRETNGIDFEDFFLHLDNGGSIFLTIKPHPEDHSTFSEEIETRFQRALREMLPDFMLNFANRDTV